MNAPTSQIVRAGGVECFLWTWLSPAEGGASKGLVLLFHGLGAHARFPSVRVAAEALARGGFTVCAPDFAGHGVSGGQRGFIHSAERLESDALLFVEAAQRAHPQLPLFLAGSSMGGAIAFQAALALGDEVRGLVLLAPMLAPAASAPAQALVTVLSYTPLSRLPLIPSVRASLLTLTLTLTLILTRTPNPNPSPNPDPSPNPHPNPNSKPRPNPSPPRATSGSTRAPTCGGRWRSP